MRTVFLPGLRDLDPIMVAPDCPTRAWSDPAAEKAVMALMESVLSEYSVDRRRVLVMGFSLGGRGTWFMESRHSDLFTAAIVMAGATDEPLEGLARIPTYIIHSRDDQVVPFAQAEQRAASLERMGRPVKFEALEGLGHFDMSGYTPALQRAGSWVAERWGK
jgi:predicted peptidase